MVLLSMLLVESCSEGLMVDKAAGEGMPVLAGELALSLQDSIGILLKRPEKDHDDMSWVDYSEANGDRSAEQSSPGLLHVQSHSAAMHRCHRRSAS